MIVRLTSLTVLLTFLMSAAALADPNWRVDTFRGESYRAAYVCPLDGNSESGNAFCLAIGCVPGQSATFRLVAVGGDMPDGVFPAHFFVDGAPTGAIMFTRNDPPGSMRGEAPVDFARHGNLIARLRDGNSAAVNQWSNDLAGAIQLGLVGSSRSIDAALSVCDTTASVPAGGLSAVEVREQLFGNFVIHETPMGEASFVYLPGGRYDGQMTVDGRGVANNGTYRLENDGRVCWDNGFARGCFRYFR